MAGTCHHLHLLQEVPPALSHSAPVLLGQRSQLFLVVAAHELSNDLLGDVAADVLLIVAFRPYPFLLHLAENVYLGRQGVLGRVWLERRSARGQLDH